MEKACDPWQTGIAVGIGVGSQPHPKAGVLDVVAGHYAKYIQGHEKVSLQNSCDTVTIQAGI